MGMEKSRGKVKFLILVYLKYTHFFLKYTFLIYNILFTRNASKMKTIPFFDFAIFKTHPLILKIDFL